MTKYSFSAFTLLLVVFYTSTAAAWGVETHASISEYAIDKSSIRQCTNGDDPACGYLASIGFVNGTKQSLLWNGKKQEAYLWLRDGASLEDTPPRWVNHFHDPVWSMGEWDKAGLLTPLGMSSPLWAQDLYYQNSFPAADDPNFWELVTVYPSLVLGSEAYKLWYGEPDWSWPAVREYFYTALTSGDDAARQEYFARTFRGVGHQMHLLEDMAVPEHVRTGGMA